MDNYLTEILESDKIALQGDGTTIKTKIIVKSNNSESTDIVLSEEDVIKSWTHTDERYVPNEGFIGQFVARTLDGELHNISDDFNIENKEIILFMGISQIGPKYNYLSTENNNNLITESKDIIIIGASDTDDTNWYKLGTFIVSKPEDDEVSDNTSFTAMDYTVLFNNDFDANFTNDIFPTSFNNTIKNGGYFTAKQLAQYTCSQVGVTFMANSFTNEDFVISTNQFTEGNSCRDVMKAISQLAYGWVRIGWDDVCYIDELETDTSNIATYNKITNDEYYSLTTQKIEYGPINTVSVGMSNIDGESISVEDPELISTIGKVNELAIYDNPITYTNDLRRESLNGAEKLFGLSYIPVELETIGHPWLKGNELIEVDDMENNAKYTHAFNRTIKYTGHIKTDLKAPSETEAEKTASFKRSLYKDLKNVKVIVNKQDGIITMLNSNIKSLENGLSSIENRLETTITDSYSKTEIQEIINGIGVDGVVVTSVKSAAGTFDMNGLTIEQSEAETKTNINANGMIIYDKSGSSDNSLLIVDSTGVTGKNVRVNTYLNIGEHSRIEDYIDPTYGPGTGIFWIGDD